MIDKDPITTTPSFTPIEFLHLFMGKRSLSEFNNNVPTEELREKDETV